MCMQRVSDWLFGNDATGLQRIPSLQELAERALKEWQEAIEYFDIVTDEDLVESAAFAVKAAERRYIYLWKLLRAKHDKDRSAHIAKNALNA